MTEWFLYCFVSAFDKCPTDLVWLVDSKSFLNEIFTVHRPLFDICTSNEDYICISECPLKHSSSKALFTTCASVCVQEPFSYVTVGEDDVFLRCYSLSLNFTLKPEFICYIDVTKHESSLISHPHSVRSIKGLQIRQFYSSFL